MRKEAAPFYNEEKEAAGIPVIHHNMNTNGINYISLVFDLSGVRAEWVPYLGVLKAVLGYMDTKDYTYEDLANEMNLHTGGFSASITAYGDVVSKDTLITKFEVVVRALYDETATALSLVRSILCSTVLEDDRRLYEVIAQAKSRMEMQLMQAGHSISAIRAMSYFSRAACFNDLAGGIGLYRLLAEAEENYEQRKDSIRDILKQLFLTVFRPENLIVSLTSDEEGFRVLSGQMEALRKDLFTGDYDKCSLKLTCDRKNEGFKNAAQVQYVSRAGNFCQHGFAYTGTLRILRTILNYDYLWMNIRVQGGAYGCMSGFGRGGDTYFSTFRDPNLRRSNEVFNGIAAYLKQFDADERDMTKYIIGTISSLDTPLNPSAKGYRSMVAYFSHLGQEDVQRERDEILKASAQDIRALEPLIASVLSEENLCVLGNEQMLEKEAGMFMTLEDLF